MRGDRLVWIDLEMTGLDIVHDRIIEIATLVTDGDLNLIAEGPNLAVTVSEEAIAGMDEWNTTHHHASGLVERIRTAGVSIDEAQAQTLAFLREHVTANTAPLCGNSVWNDKRFLEKEMPDIVEFLHYRMIDVSTIKELARRWYPDVPRYPKKGAHLALDDIRESVEELRHFRERVFKS
ncbi:MAG TPA: oligoribonuclease [Candidatus Poseidoniaceae archaeon]|nr:MAG: oligoribonuclease [Euryarchaeota archaeon TMED141]DAC10952.1 MAG TPA: oligoribonuclease [Candidatus Poseidoniales archaeon]DAC17850.1 MAG TPA: oligoribonuclease [Candidatus Poseidoniales archaeon]HII18102.1 oligoribonuclease [Candidatus Poseidoniaceae archaeon]HII96654.1 oligoribonuclease [Candidatus Poseidoniaceae archaeon]|tara:strand:+ start:96 stop:632 length:537 start_codon:yes stop_codon:yes gene_type:complete